MHYRVIAFKLYIVALCASLFFACSSGGGTTSVSELQSSGSAGDSIIVTSSGDTIYVKDGYTRVITEDGDTVYVKDTVAIYADTTLRWIGNSALVITEIASLNLDWLDMDGDDPAWVEIYNAGTISANLKGYSLVENLKEPKKWVFGDELVAPKSFRTVFCDKKNISTVASAQDGKDEVGNVLHNRTHTNWKMDKSGGTIYLIDPSNGIRDSVVYPELAPGLSWGIVDGGDWKYFAVSTPEKKNTEATAYEGMAPSVNMDNIKAGFYSNPITIDPPTVESGVTVRCTMDGSAPTENSEAFTSAKTISSNTVLRCAAYKKGTITKDVITKSIFIGESVRMPVVSISVDPQFFSKYYKNTHGGTPDMDHDQMYAPNKSYPNDSGEMPAHVEYFENGSNSDGKAWDIEAGISLMGGWSRMEHKKSLAVVMREEYQEGWLHYSLFDTRKSESDKYKAFNLRNNGNRFVSDYFADALGGAILEGSGVDYQRSRQVVVFYNGKYYGIHDMRERYNKNFVESNYGIDANTVEVIKHLGDDITSNTTTTNYENLLSFVNTNDFSGENNANYNTLKTMMDVGNYADYMAAEIYLHNGDWPNNNVRAWRSPDQPYKFMIYDLDHGFDWQWGVNGFSEYTNMFSWVKQGGRSDGECYSPGKDSFSGDKARCFHTIYVRLMKNPDFKRLFINRSAYMLQNFLNAQKMEQVRAVMAGSIDAEEAERDLDTHGQRDRGYSHFSVSNSGLTTWAEGRDTEIISQYKSEFGVGDLVTVQVNVSGSGSVLIEGRQVPSSYSGQFFSGNKMELTAVPTGSAVFTGWSDNATDNPRIVDVKDGLSLTAKFQ